MSLASPHLLRAPFSMIYKNRKFLSGQEFAVSARFSSLPPKPPSVSKRRQANTSPNPFSKKEKKSPCIAFLLSPKFSGPGGEKDEVWDLGGRRKSRSRKNEKGQGETGGGGGEKDGGRSNCFDKAVGWVKEWLPRLFVGRNRFRHHWPYDDQKNKPRKKAPSSFLHPNNIFVGHRGKNSSRNYFWAGFFGGVSNPKTKKIHLPLFFSHPW